MSARLKDLFDHQLERGAVYYRSDGSGECEWYTPPSHLALAREVLGSIDLDPASSDVAQETVQAKHYFTKTENGLIQPWRGSVWLNPPYGQPTLGKFVGKLLQERDLGRVREAILLTNNCTDASWFHAAAAGCDALCFLRGRIRFQRPGGDPGSPAQGQTFFYFGANIARFAEVFGQLGVVTVMPAPASGGRLL